MSITKNNTEQHTDMPPEERKEQLLAMQNEYLPGSAEHGALTGSFAAMLGAELGMETDIIAILERAAALHDIGKCTVPREITLKPGPLTEEEMAVMRTHAENGQQLLEKNNMITEAQTALCHHEHFDGKGYPAGLSGSNIPLFARITAVADTFVVLHYGRPYRKPISQTEALAEICRNAGTQFDPEITAAFETVIHTLEESEQ